MAKQWARQFNSANNFDIVLVSPNELNSKWVTELLDRIQSVTHRGLSLSARADKEFRRWCKHPDTPLKSEAYVLLSNWFLTQSGDRHSTVASHCEALWDELFPCRPSKRLSSPEPGRNHVMVPSEFESFWAMIMNAQREDQDNQLRESAEVIARINVEVEPPQSKPFTEIRPTVSASQPDAKSAPEHQAGRHLTIAQAKTALAWTFGVSPDSIEITIRG